MKKDSLVYIDDIVDCVRAIKKYTKGFTKEKFLKKPEKQDAVFYRIGLIGEAANKVSSGFMKKYSEIPWSQIIAMRNKIIHDYDEVDPNLIWGVVKKDIPKLEKQLKNIEGIDF
jgi:uncharacterized protein with HEPN domain